MTISYVTIRKFCELTGYTEKAVRAKIQEGVWLRNRVYRKAPDGHILIKMEGFWEWVETGMVNKREDDAARAGTRRPAPTGSPLPPDLRATSPKSGRSPLPIVLPKK